jgi:CBS domain-containing protein
MKLVYILLVLALLRNILLYKTYHSIPIIELKRRARQSDKKAASLYRVANYDRVFDLRQWLFCTAVGTVLIIWSARTNWWLATIFLVAAAWLIAWTKFPAGGWAGDLAALFAPFDAKVLSILNPILSRIAARLPRNRWPHLHTGLYEKNDLLALLDKQNKQVDNRIDSSDLRIASGAMSFGDKLVRDVMTPRRAIKFVAATESIGPLLMDELHKSGHSRFPVTKNVSKAASPDLVGTLYLKDVIGHEGGGKVKDLARKDVYYINEDSNLRQALSAFLKTHHHLLIVVNNFEEIAGVLSIEDVMEQIIGQPITDEFDNYEDLRAVAKEEARNEKEKHNEIPVAPKAE